MWEAPTTMKTSLFIVIITLPILTTSILIGLQPRTATALPSWERFVYVCFFYAWGFVCVCLGMCVCKRVIDANSRHLSVPHLKIPGLFFIFFYLSQADITGRILYSHSLASGWAWNLSSICDVCYHLFGRTVSLTAGLLTPVSQGLLHYSTWPWANTHTHPSPSLLSWHNQNTLIRIRTSQCHININVRPCTVSVCLHEEMIFYAYPCLNRLSVASTVTFCWHGHTKKKPFFVAHRINQDMLAVTQVLGL